MKLLILIVYLTSIEQKSPLTKTHSDCIWWKKQVYYSLLLHYFLYRAATIWIRYLIHHSLPPTSGSCIYIYQQSMHVSTLDLLFRFPLDNQCICYCEFPASVEVYPIQHTSDKICPLSTEGRGCPLVIVVSSTNNTECGARTVSVAESGVKIR